jgi:hypothetical protein
MLNKSHIKFVVYINPNEKFIKLFSHHKQVFSIKYLFSALIIKLKTGFPYNLLFLSLIIFIVVFESIINDYFR